MFAVKNGSIFIFDYYGLGNKTFLSTPPSNHNVPSYLSVNWSLDSMQQMWKKLLLFFLITLLQYNSIFIHLSYHFMRASKFPSLAVAITNFLILGLGLDVGATHRTTASLLHQLVLENFKTNKAKKRPERSPGCSSLMFPTGEVLSAVS